MHRALFLHLSERLALDNVNLVVSFTESSDLPLVVSFDGLELLNNSGSLDYSSGDFSLLVIFFILLPVGSKLFCQPLHRYANSGGPWLRILIQRFGFEHLPCSVSNRLEIALPF